MPSVPHCEQINFGWLVLCRGCGRPQFQVRKRSTLLSFSRFSIHGHVQKKHESTSHSQSLLHRARVLVDCFVSAMLGCVPPRTCDDNASYSAEICVVDLKIQHLAGDARDDRIF